MKIAESQLRKVIRQAIIDAKLGQLQEAAIKPVELPKDLSIVVYWFHDSFSVLLARKSGKSQDFVGEIYVSMPERIPDEIGNCHNACMIETATTGVKGTGPLLYDVAIDVASYLAGGLMSDRKEVSSDARRVWSYIEKNRPDIIKKQLDSHDNELTPDEIDNCKVDVAGDDWVDDPLSKVAYRPGLPVVKELLALKKIKLDNDMKRLLGKK